MEKCPHTKLIKCDVIKQKESELENMDFEIQPFVFYCFTNLQLLVGLSLELINPVSWGFSPNVALKMPNTIH